MTDQKKPTGLRYPLSEGVEFRYVCPGCNARHMTTVPRHKAPFLWRCQVEGCGWTLTIQSDEAGLSVGYTAPLPQTPKLELVK